MSLVKFNGKARIVSTMAFALVTVLYSLTKKEPTDRIKVSRESLHGGEDAVFSPGFCLGESQGPLF